MTECVLNSRRVYEGFAPEDVFGADRIYGGRLQRCQTCGSFECREVFGGGEQKNADGFGLHSMRCQSCGYQGYERVGTYGRYVDEEK